MGEKGTNSLNFHLELFRLFLQTEYSSALGRVFKLPPCCHFGKCCAEAHSTFYCNGGAPLWVSMQSQCPCDCHGQECIQKVKLICKLQPFLDLRDLVTANSTKQIAQLAQNTEIRLSSERHSEHLTQIHVPIVFQAHFIVLSLTFMVWNQDLQNTILLHEPAQILSSSLEVLVHVPQ